jgi:Tol biopolymer transport system component
MVVVSPDGERVVFNTKVLPPPKSSSTPSSRLGILRLEEGTEPVWVGTGLATLSMPTWSPDGSSVAYMGWQPGTDIDFLVIYNVHSGMWRTVDLTPGYVAIQSPRWSPTGEWIAFVRWDARAREQLWIVRPDGAMERQVSKSDRVGVSGAHWSPDGAKLYYIRKRSANASGGDIYMVNIHLPGRPDLQVTHGLNCLDVVLSPDEQYLLCDAYPEPDSRRTSVYLVSVRDPGQSYLVVNQGAAAFSPRGNWIVFRDAQDCSLYKMALSEKPAKTMLTRGVSGLASRTAWNVLDQIVFTRDENQSLWMINQDGSEEREIFRLGTRF